LLVVIGFILLVSFVFYSAFYLATLTILIVTFIFWGFMLFHNSSSKYVLSTLLNATNDLSNIERILTEANTNQKGVYLPPKKLKNPESSLVFIPEEATKALPEAQESHMNLLPKEKNGVFLTPPGFSLSRLFEIELKYSFTKIDLSSIQSVLLNVMVEKMDIADDVKIEIQGNSINVEVTNSVLEGLCQQTQDLARTHNQVGCVLSSSIACALAKASGKPIIIQKETKRPQTKITQIEYFIQKE
jgi:hypothetical protein